VAAVAALGGSPQNNAQDPDPATSQSPTEEAAPSESAEPTEPSETSSEPPEASDTATVPAYFVGDTPQGPRLFREFRRVEDTGPGLSGLALLESGPLDPDYRSLWPEGAFETVSDPEAGVVHVQLASTSFADRPASMTEAEAHMAVEQVIYTVQAGFQERLAVQFRIGENPTPRVLGVPTSEPLANGPMLETLGLVNITSPEEGATVSDSFTASGVANSFEATVPWEIRQGDRVVAKGFATADGWMDKLYPWTTQVNVSKLAPGTYTFAAMTDDPSGGAEGAGPAEDTKTIVVK
jgi:Immunoglobulin-like domain of bacterial spore germination